MEERTEVGERFEGSIGGSAFTGTGRPSRTFARGRVCAEDGCGTRLSIYNEGHYCSQHEPQAAPRLRGRKIA
ncbi:MAG TPA: hypothetical protein DCQ30_15065 [Acidimicrobiaceae bacterium]|nr:hypothetical protein [Acidimicrobiaceae bacterium]